MRNPENLLNVAYKNQPEEIFKVENVPDFDIEDYDLCEPKDFKKYATTVEKIVRGSFEYKRLVGFLRDYMDMNKCSVYEEVTNATSHNIKIHIHHEPITLYDIFLTVYNKRVANREPLSEDMVAKEIMFNHYKMRVGLIPLAETVHELVHNQYIFVPTTAVFGKYWEFIEVYHDFVEPETLDTLAKIEEITKRYSLDAARNLLSTNLIYIDTDDVFGKKDLGEVKQLLKDRLNEANKES